MEYQDRGKHNSDPYFPVDKEKRAKEAESECLGTKIALMVFGGKSQGEICKELNFGHQKVKRIMKTDEYIVALRELEDEALKVAKYTIRLGVSKIAREVLRVIEHHLENNNLQAVAPALKILGFNDNEAPTTDQKITIVMPSYDSPINITPEKEANDRI